MDQEKQPKEPQKYLQFLLKLNATCIDLAKYLKFNKTNKWHNYLLYLYGTILELSNSICVLIKSNSSIGIPILLRSMLEAFIDFSNLAEEQSYSYHIDAAGLNEMIKIFEEAKKGENPYLKEISKLPNLDQMFLQKKAQLEELIKKGYKPLSNKQKFDKSKQTIEYCSIYNSLCCDSHNNIGSLISRHLDIAKDGSNFNLQFFLPVDIDSITNYIDSCLVILINSTEKVHAILGSTKIDETKRLSARLSEIRKQCLLEENNHKK